MINVFRTLEDTEGSGSIILKGESLGIFDGSNFYTIKFTILKGTSLKILDIICKPDISF